MSASLTDPSRARMVGPSTVRPEKTRLGAYLPARRSLFPMPVDLPVRDTISMQSEGIIMNDADATQGTTPDVDEDTLAELRRRLADLAGEDVVLTDQQLLSIFFPVGATTSTEGSVAFRSVILPRKFCRNETLLDASGQTVTGGNGSVTFLLSDVLCSTLNDFTGPVNLEATPVIPKPIYVTSQYTLVPNPGTPGSFNDLQITLMTWAPNGSPAPSVTVDWRCRVVAVPIIL